MATSRFRYGDSFTFSEYKETGSLCPEEEGRIFADELEKNMGNGICCIPSFKVDEKDVTTIGLGDAFVGGFLAAMVQR